MVDKEIRKKINIYNEQELGPDEEDGIKILDDPSFDKSIIGITSDHRLVYDYEKMIEELMQDDKCSYDDAVEFLEYNTMRAMPYIQSNNYAPLILYTKITDIEE